MKIDLLHLFFIINEKGGAAKTTSSINLFGQLKAMGFRPFIIDCDTRGRAAHLISSLGDGWLRGNVARADASTMEYFELLLTNLADSDEYDCVIFDTPPHIGEEVNNLLKIAKRYEERARIIVPVLASAQDIGISKKVISYIQDINDGQKVYVLPSNIERRTVMGRAISGIFAVFDNVELLAPIYKTTEIPKNGSAGETLNEIEKPSEMVQRVIKSMETNVREMGVSHES